jgi:hypothetical protein|tara:strand:- start:2041 stop:3237 length:1197 start_codon:yes stop_codon:yes gene_type:complete
MAIINNADITAQLQDLASGGTIDSSDVVALLNSALPAGQQISSTTGVSSGIYKRFGEFDKVNAKVEVVTTGLWTGDTGSLTAAFTSSTQVAATSGDYYYNVYNANPASDTSAEVQFGVAYGHVNGSGSVSLQNSDDALLASKATYAQYKSVLLDPTDSKFSFENGAGIAADSNAIYAVNINRARYREKMDPGNWSLNLSGSKGLYQFIDDSGKKFGDTLGKAGRVFKVVSGSLNLGTESAAIINSTTSSDDKGFGLFYPDKGIIVLNPDAIGETVGDIDGQGNVSGSLLVTVEEENHKLLYNSIDLGADFQARRTENVSTRHFFVRATNREFNYSNNPTYVNANGTFAETSFETDPKVYITTVGLLNDANELIAVAKTSQPIEKSFDKEVLIKVKLSF